MTDESYDDFGPVEPEVLPDPTVVDIVLVRPTHGAVVGEERTVSIETAHKLVRRGHARYV